METPAAPLSAKERADWMARVEGVALASDAFFPFRDNIDRAKQVNLMRKI